MSILQIFSKAFKKLLEKQLLAFSHNILPRFQYGFRKGYGTQSCLSMMLEFFKDADKAFGVLPTDLSKAFDCLCDDLLIAKLHAYGLYMPSLNLLQDYWLNRKQRTKVDSLFNPWEDILSGVPQGSIQNPLLFHIFMFDMFLILKTVYFTSYADGSTPFAVANSIEDV